MRAGEPWRPLDADEYRWCGAAVVSEQLLGRIGEQWFGLGVLDGASAPPDGWIAADLRKLLPAAPQRDYALLSRARQVLHWFNGHRRCGRCGSATEMASKEPALCCGECGALWYPKVSPCIITLVLKGEELLLARNANFPGRFFSTLAGFVDVGESLEQTLEREVMEEVSVQVENLRYFSSQSWPFPSQLMLGFFADYKAGEITPDGEEIIEAGWYHYRQLPPVPPPGFSIAGELIATAVNALSRGDRP